MNHLLYLLQVSARTPLVGCSLYAKLRPGHCKYIYIQAAMYNITCMYVVQQYSYQVYKDFNSYNTIFHTLAVHSLEGWVYEHMVLNESLR